MTPLARQRARFGLGGTGAPDLDLVPLIDCVFLMLLFFVLCGRLSLDSRSEQITVPPAKSARVCVLDHWKHEVVNLAAAGDHAPARIRVGARTFDAAPGEGYRGLRALFDDIYAQAPKYRDPDPDPRHPHDLLPEVIVELRADADCDMRRVQEVLAVLADSVDPATMRGRRGGAARQFVHVDFTVRPTRAH